MAPAQAGRSRPPVMADVARLAGVSHQTVSRVLNAHPNVKPQTRDSVLAAIAELGYRPNAAARTLVTRRTRTLGVVSFDTTLYGPASMLYGIERAAAHSYFVSIASLPALDRRSVLGAVDRFLDQGVEGIIVIAPTTAAVAACSRIRAHVPLVALGCGTHAPLTSAAVDNGTGAALATRYLLGLGHRTVHHIAGPASWLDAQERISGWREALAKAGAPEPELLPVGVPAGAADRRQSRDHRGVLRERPHGARADPGARGTRAAGAPRHQRGGVRRHTGIGLLPAPADHGAPGLRRTGPAGPGHPGGHDQRPPGASGLPADRTAPGGPDQRFGTRLSPGVSVRRGRAARARRGPGTRAGREHPWPLTRHT